MGKRKTSALRTACEHALRPGGRVLSVDDGTPGFSPRDLAELTGLAESGALKPVIDRRYPLEEIAEAHRYVELERKKGNVVISIIPDGCDLTFPRALDADRPLGTAPSGAAQLGDGSGIAANRGMSLRSSVSPLGSLAKVAIGLEILLGIGAVGGGIALMAGPNGEIIPLPVAALDGSCFTNYFVPGAILFTVLGVGPMWAAALGWRRNATAPYLALAVGVALVVWIAVEIGVVGYSNDPPLQALYLALGVVIALIGVAWLRKNGSLASRVRPSTTDPRSRPVGHHAATVRDPGRSSFQRSTRAARQR